MTWPETSPLGEPHKAVLTREQIQIMGGAWTGDDVSALHEAHRRLWPGSLPFLAIGDYATYSASSGAGGTADAPGSDPGA